MNFAGDLRAWLLWVIKIRFLIITLVFAIEYGVRQVVHSPGNLLSLNYLGSAVILWYLLGLFYLVYYQVGRDYLLQAHLQLYLDIAIDRKSTRLNSSHGY